MRRSNPVWFQALVMALPLAAIPSAALADRRRTPFFNPMSATGGGPAPQSSDGSNESFTAA